MRIYYHQKYNFNSADAGNTAKSIAVQLYSVDDTEAAKDYYLCLRSDAIYGTESSKYRIEHYKTRFGLKNSNFVFTVNNVLGEVLFYSLDPDGTGNAVYEFETLKKSGAEFSGISDFYFFDLKSIFKLRIVKDLCEFTFSVPKTKYFSPKKDFFCKNSSQSRKNVL